MGEPGEQAVDRSVLLEQSRVSRLRDGALVYSIFRQAAFADRTRSLFPTDAGNNQPFDGS